MTEKTEDQKYKTDLNKKTVLTGLDPLSKMKNNGKFFTFN